MDGRTALTIAALGWLLLLLLPGPTPGHAARLEDRIVAVVNKELVMLSDLKKELGSEPDQLQKQFRGEELERRVKTAEYRALTRIIERLLQLQTAKAKGVEVADIEVKQAVEELKRRGDKIDASDPASAQNIREQLMMLRLVDRDVRSGVMVGELEMRRYYEQHKDRFALPEEYVLSQILILPKSEDRAEALGRARAVVKELKDGGNFEELALRFSDGINASRGGRVGLVRQGELHPPIERALASLSPGELSEIVETTEGFHIVRLDEKKDRQYRPFDVVKLEIQSLVFQQKSEDVYQTWIADLKNKSYIEIKF
jgi:peptidyl-prolyl cis-trans isomerase SurA